MTNILRRPGSLAALCVLLSGTPDVQAGPWMSLGPDGGGVESITIDPVTPNVVYATGNAGGWKSVDGGLTWSLLDGIFAGRVPEIGVDPLSHSTLYAPQGDHVWKSTDAGATWTSHPTGVELPFSFAIDPVTPSNLWVGDNKGKVLRSTDGGITWTPTPLVSGATALVHELAVDPVTPTTVWAAASFGAGFGLHKSVDGGASFTATGLPDPLIPTLAVHPTASGTVLATGFGHLYKTTDGGLGWAASDTGLSGGIGPHGVAFDPVNPLNVYAVGAGLAFKSVDGGTTWAPSDTGLSRARALQSVVVDPLAPSTVLAASPIGVARSTDGGGTWTIHTRGLRTTSIRSIAVDPTRPRTVYATTTDFDVVKSVDGGGTWTPINSGVPAGLADHVLVDPTMPSTLYLSLVYGSGVYKSTDAGGSWSRSDSGLTASMRRIALAPTDPAILYAATYGGVYKSVDGAASWVATALRADTMYVAIDPTSADVVYAAGRSDVYKSIDGGSTWTSSVLIAPSVFSPVSALAVDPGNPARVYAGTSGGFSVEPTIFVSLDGGSSWAPSVFRNVNDIVFLTGPPALVIAAGRGGVVASNDHGVSWVDLTPGLPPVPAGAAVAEPSTIYAATWGAGVWARSIEPCAADVDCDDGSLCTIDACNPGNGNGHFLGCVHTPVVCPIAPDCQVATCSPDAGCQNQAAPDDTVCSEDGSICTTDVCRSGACAHDPNVLLTCKAPGEAKASTLVAKNLGPKRRRLTWKWRKGTSTSLAELGNPSSVGGSDYTLCAFDRSGPGGTWALVASVRAPAGGVCARRPCWVAGRAVTFRYKNRHRTPDGATNVDLTAGNPATITVKAKGSNLLLPPAALVPEVRVQLRRDDDLVCWEARFRTFIRRDSPGRFKAKSDR